MTKFLTGLAMAVVAAGLVAAPALADKVTSAPGTLNVFDEGKLFTSAGIDKAKSAMNGTTFNHGLTMTIDTYGSIPEDKKASYSKDKEEPFFRSWAQELAKNDKARGIYVLVCRSPGYVEVIADRETRDRGFKHEHEVKLKNTLLASFRSAKDKPEAEQFEIRDKGLKAAVDYVVSDLKDTHVAGGTTHTNTTNTKKAGGMSIGGWICLGLCILLGVWLVIGLIRALTGGGGGGYGGGGYGGGGGGGGFMSSLFGGLFGAMAGMWLYNNMFGHSGMMGGTDAYAGDNYGGGGGGDTGAGDFGGDEGAGGSFDDGGTGGGDYGGGGGDWGGGGDTGGGGDWGGGGGDFGGGGGDF
jgi:hypothetical protein